MKQAETLELTAVMASILLAAAIPIATSVGTIIANELEKWSKAGYPMPKLW